MKRPSVLSVPVAIAVVLLAMVMSTSTALGAGDGCDRVASIHGSDYHGNGSLRRPFRSLRRLDAALRPGQTGCLMGGHYGSVSTWLPLDRGGTAGAPVTIRAYPGQSATVEGWIEVIGSYITLQGLGIDDSNDFSRHGSSSGSCPHPGVSVGLSIEGTGDVLQYDDIYQSVAGLRGTGIGVGWQGSGAGTVIRYNRIHDVGACRDLDHLIYIVRGAGSLVYDNWMWNDPHGWGVQLYPEAQHIRVFDNVIDHAGSGVIVGGGPSTAYNYISHNVILNSTGFAGLGLDRRLSNGVGVSDTWDAGAGPGNVFAFNDCFGERGGRAEVSAVVVRRNINVNPRFVDARHHDYRLRAGSPLVNWGLWQG